MAHQFVGSATEIDTFKIDIHVLLRLFWCKFLHNNIIDGYVYLLVLLELICYKPL